MSIKKRNAMGILFTPSQNFMILQRGFVTVGTETRRYLDTELDIYYYPKPGVLEIDSDTQTLRVVSDEPPSASLAIQIYSNMMNQFDNLDLMKFELPFIIHDGPLRVVGAQIVTKPRKWWEFHKIFVPDLEVEEIKGTGQSHPCGILELSGGWKWKDERSEEIATKSARLWIEENPDWRKDL